MSEDRIVGIFIGTLVLLVIVGIGAVTYALTHPADQDCDVTLIQMPSGNGTTHLQPTADCEDTE